MFVQQYAQAIDSNDKWNAIDVTQAKLYQWDSSSTYIQEPPFLVDVTPEVGQIQPIAGARVLALLGDSVTTDHISPAAMARGGETTESWCEAPLPTSASEISLHPAPKEVGRVICPTDNKWRSTMPRRSTAKKASA